MKLPLRHTRLRLTFLLARDGLKGRSIKCIKTIFMLDPGKYLVDPMLQIENVMDHRQKLCYLS